MKNSKQKVVIYTKPRCPYCIKAKELLEKKGVEYKEVDVDRETPEGTKPFEEIKSKYDVKTVPQIFIIDESGYVHHIAGNDKLQELNNKGKLDDMLNNNYNNTDVTNDTNSDMGCVEYGECTIPNNCDDFM
ncbi:MAG: glutaredoxin domain-containing protein [Wolbachia sp.]|nr:glutaredoxin domain-containing protein [Wolbachia sp.]MDD9335971.1 glutaredoxin domain-containing protein [Wolbachia sp.]